MVPDVLVDPDGVDPDQPVGVVGQLLQPRLDRLPDRVPVHPEPAGHRGDGGVVALDAADRPPGHPHGELGARRSQRVVLAEAADRAGALGTAVATLPPAQLDRSAERRDVVQPPWPSTASFGDHPARRAPGLGRARLHDQTQSRRETTPALKPGDIKHVHAQQIEQGIDACAVATRLHAARHRLSHRRGPSVGLLGRNRS